MMNSRDNSLPVNILLSLFPYHIGNIVLRKLLFAPQHILCIYIRIPIRSINPDRRRYWFFVCKKNIVSLVVFSRSLHNMFADFERIDDHTVLWLIISDQDNLAVFPRIDSIVCLLSFAA